MIVEPGTAQVNAGTHEELRLHRTLLHHRSRHLPPRRVHPEQ